MGRWRTRCVLLGVMLAFVAAGMLFVSRLGIEADEASIANGIFDHGDPWYSLHFGANEVPLMMMSYYGALKTWFYNGLFLLTPPRPVALRLPMLILAAVSLWLFFALLDETVGRTAAWIGTALLATDSCYLLLNMADYGPVTLQFVFKLAAILLFVRFYRSGSRWELAGGFFLIGLALWDKAVFLWILFGLGVAVVAVFPRELRSVLNVRNAAIALAATIAGALPLVVYNIDRPLETLRKNANVEGAPGLAKASVLAATIDGRVLFGFLTAADPGSIAGRPRHWFQNLSVSAARWTGHPHRNLILPALAASILTLGFLWRTSARKPILFGTIACVATWIPMAVTAGAGATAQHTVLLWPFHFMAIAAALAQAPVRLAAAAAAVLCLTNVAVTNQYYADLIQNGPAVRWTDATHALKQYLVSARPARIYAADWGFAETLNLLSEGAMPVYMVDMASPAAEDRMIAFRHTLFVAHTRDFAYWPEMRAELDSRARQDGYEEQQVTTISDRNGRPTFDVFRFRKIHL